MRIDPGVPIEIGKSGVFQRLKRIQGIHTIDYDYCLDLGAGKGAYATELTKYAKQVIALDMNLGYIKACRAQDKKVFPLVGKAEKLPLLSNSIDSVFLIETLEHVISLEESLGEISRITKSGATINITVPYKFFILETHHIYLFGKTFDGRFFPFFPMFSAIFNLVGAARRFSIYDLNRLFHVDDYELIGYSHMTPPFDNMILIQKLIKPLLQLIEKCKLYFLCPTLVAVYKKR